MYSNQKEYIQSVEIHRDGLYSPWGFRLKGGIDVDGGIPLEIVKVFVGSASEGLLMPGDRVVGINHQDASKLTHLEAQNLMKSAGTTAKVDVVRQGTGAGVFIDPNNDYPERQFEASKVQSQPFRTTPLVTPTPKTINDVQSQQKVTTAATNFGVSRPAERIPPPSPISTLPHQAKNVNIGGNQKQILSQQFNSPLNIYSDDAIAYEATVNPSIVQANTPTLNQIQNQYHPGYVPSSKPHLPTPRDATFSRPQASETFKLILESEMDKAKDHPNTIGSEFTKEKQVSRPSSVMSNNSSKTNDPFMMNNNINQSTSFKRLMYSVLGEAEL